MQALKGLLDGNEGEGDDELNTSPPEQEQKIHVQQVRQTNQTQGQMSRPQITMDPKKQIVGKNNNIN